MQAREGAPGVWFRWGAVVQAHMTTMTVDYPASIVHAAPRGP